MIKWHLSQTKYQQVEKGEKSVIGDVKTITYKAEVIHGSYMDVHEGDNGIMRVELPEGIKFFSVAMERLILKDTVDMTPEVKSQWQREVLADVVGTPKGVLAILYCTSEADLKRLFVITTRIRVSWKEESLKFNKIVVNVEELKKINFPPKLVADLRKLKVIE
ncbi:MAG: hypothetical protein ACREBU_00850 [Nitrososphaera sp.]